MDILELLHYTFFQHALLGSLFASIYYLLQSSPYSLPLG